MNLGSLKSKKLIIGVLAAAGIVVNDYFGSPISKEAMYSALGILATYILGQGIADHGAQGAATAVKRAIKDGEQMAAAVQGVLGAKNGNGEAPVHDDDPDADGPDWEDTAEVDAEDEPKELNG